MTQLAVHEDARVHERVRWRADHALATWEACLWWLRLRRGCSGGRDDAVGGRRYILRYLSARRARGLAPPSAARDVMQDFRLEVLQAGELGVVRDSPVQGTSAHARA